MSETRGTYNVNPVIPKALDPQCKLPFDDPNFKQPDGDQVRTALAIGGLTGSVAGALLGVDGRTIRKWTGNEREIPFSAWRLLLALIGEITIKAIKKAN